MLKNLLVLILLGSFSQITTAQETGIQNIYGRNHLSLNGRWNYIIDPYEMGYYDYRREPFDQSSSGKGGFFDDRKQQNKGEVVEYNFDIFQNSILRNRYFY